MEPIKFKIKFKHIAIATIVVFAAIMFKFLVGYNTATQLLAEVFLAFCDVINSKARLFDGCGITVHVLAQQFCLPNGKT